MKKFIKSPFNYVGNKYKQLPQLFQIFPDKINNFIDLFCGGCDVSINMLERANKIYANDINRFVIEILQEFKNNTIEEILQFIDERIKQFDLAKDKEEGYYQYRILYNNGTHSTPLDLFALTRYSFNNNLRFNNKQEMNQASGIGRSWFNPQQRKNTILLHQAVQNIQFSCKNFRDFDLTPFNKKDFIYVDPPYLISSAYYNSGAKEADQRWEERDDFDLFNYLDKANTNFAMSNFIYHKGQTNKGLIEWIKDNHYKTYDIHSDYTHCVANIVKNDNPTLEVVITNYDKEDNNNG